MTLALNLERQQASTQNVLERLKNKKVAQVEIKRVRNKIEAAVAVVTEHMRSGRLVNTGHQMCIMAKDRDILVKYCNLIKRNGEYSMDLETAGLDPYNDFIVGVCLYTPNPNEKRLYIPLNHTDINNIRHAGQMTEQDIIGIMGDVLEGDYRWTNAYNKFDYKFVKVHLGLTMRNIHWDTWLGAKLLNENEVTHELKPLYAKYVEKSKDWLKADTFGDLFGKSIPFNYMPIDAATIYGADDPYKAFKLMQFQRNHLRLDHPKKDMRQIAHVFHNIEMPLVSVVGDMELNGVECNKDYAGELAAIFREQLETVQTRLDAYVTKYVSLIKEHAELARLAKVEKSGEVKLNFNSPQQLSAFLYDILKCPEGIKQKRDDSERGTGEFVLTKLIERKKEHTQFFNDLLKFREVAKLLGTYVEKMPNEINSRTGRIHGSFNQYGADTGRFSSSDPNLQNIPSHEKRIRKMFKAAEGCALISSDYSQIEPRTLAFMAGEENMIAAYRAGRDLYSDMASRVFNKPYEECGDGTEERQRIKAILLGIMYEKDAKTIAKEFNKPASWGVKLVGDFMQTYPKIKLFKLETIHMAETLGYVTTHSGRKRRLPDMQLDRESMKYSIAYRKCVNARIQGTALDIMKLAMIKVGNDPVLRELGCRMIMTVHDELISEVPEANAGAAAKRKRELMVEAAQEVLIGMPVKCDLEITKVWYGEKLNSQYLAA